MGFLMPSVPTAGAPAAPPPAAAPAQLANPAVAATAANNRARALAAAGSAPGTNPDLQQAPAVAKPALLGPS